MKRTLFYLVICLFIVGCAEKKEKESPAAATFSGEHELRKMFDSTGDHSKTSGCFFAFFGGITSETKSEMTVHFSWKMNDGNYAISSIPLEKIRINFDNECKCPTIKFKWAPSDVDVSNDLQKYINSNICYVLVTVKESDWPSNVQLPLNK